MNIQLPFGREQLEVNIKKDKKVTIIENGIDSYNRVKNEQELIEEALEHPVRSDKLSVLAQGCNNVVIITSDQTRPVPSRLIIPLLVREIYKGNSNAKISLLVATGCHRAPSKDELVKKFGEKILQEIPVFIHNCDAEDLIDCGFLQSGNHLYVNKLAYDADLLISEGVIEPHFFAGYSGGRKSILPGIAGRSSIKFNHSAKSINEKNCTTGILEKNIIHQEMQEAAEKIKLKFILNVMLNSKKEVVYAVAGDCKLAHQKGVEWLEGICKKDAVLSDVVLVTNNGYPLDQNIYQTVKGISTAAKTCRKNGVIIMVAACEDGVGGDAFGDLLKEDKSIQEIMQEILNTDCENTRDDQWQVQILLKILLDYHVILVSKCSHTIVRDMRFLPCDSVQEALEQAENILEKSDYTITVIPEGVSTIINTY